MIMGNETPPPIAETILQQAREEYARVLEAENAKRLAAVKLDEIKDQAKTWGQMIEAGLLNVRGGML